MKELYVFTSSREREKLIRLLGELGVVDLSLASSQERSPSPYDPLIEDVDKVLQILGRYDSKKNKKTRDTHTPFSASSSTHRILTISKALDKVEQQLEELLKQEEVYRFWGEDSNANDIAYLGTKGLYLRLYLLERPYKEVPGESRTIVRLRKSKGRYPMVLVSREQSARLEEKEVFLPKMSFGEIQEQLHKRKRQQGVFLSFLKQQAHRIQEYEQHREEIDELRQARLAFDGVQEIDEKICYVHGYIPSDSIASFEELASAHSWGYAYNEPDNPEIVPVYIRNPRWIRTIEPLMKFIDIIPGYKEMDVSVFFLFAFVLFFAMLVGDAGYGALFLISTLLLWKKFTPQARSLSLVLSIGTIVWGALSGTYFGSRELAEIPLLKSFIVKGIASFGQDNADILMHLTFIIGAVHLSLARLVRLIMYINSIRALRELGWIALIWGLFLLTQQLVLGMEMPSWGFGLMIAGGCLVILGSFESRRPGGSLAGAMTNLPFDLINSFSDIVSYVRLFAVGMATAWVAASFNNMILPSLNQDPSLWEHIALIIALCLGHGLNIALALMAVMVHGIRLNMLEFSGQLGVQFSGIAYRPFRLKYPERVVQAFRGLHKQSITKTEGT